MQQWITNTTALTYFLKLAIPYHNKDPVLFKVCGPISHSVKEKKKKAKFWKSYISSACKCQSAPLYSSIMVLFQT